MAELYGLVLNNHFAVLRQLGCACKGNHVENVDDISKVVGAELCQAYLVWVVQSITQVL